MSEEKRSDRKLAELNKKNLARANLSEANLTEAKLSGANLIDAKFVRAELTGADFRNTNISKVRGLTMEQIRAAKVDESTKIPRAFKDKMPKVGKKEK